MADQGYSAQASLSHFIRHEAGHVLLYWLLDRPLAGCIVTDKAGLTHAIRTDDTQEQIIPHILVALSGMVMSSEFEVIDELEEHLHEPRYFHDNTDSRIVAEAMQTFDPAHRLPLLFQFRLLLSRLKGRFAKGYAEIRRLLTQPPYQLFFIELNQLFQKWDLANGFDKRPKSDVVMRMFRRIARQPLPKGQWLDWGNDVLSEWKYKPTSLKETVMLIVREQMQDATPDHRLQLDSLLAVLEKLPDEMVAKKTWEAKGEALLGGTPH